MPQDSSSGSEAGGQVSTTYDHDTFTRMERDIKLLLGSGGLEDMGRVESGSLHTPAAGAAGRPDRLYRTGGFMPANERNHHC